MGTKRISTITLSTLALLILLSSLTVSSSLHAASTVKSNTQTEDISTLDDDSIVVVGSGIKLPEYMTPEEFKQGLKEHK